MMPLIVDLFAGGGGTSTGIEMALGRSPDIAVNHDPAALAMHRANHPATIHYREDVWKVSPAAVCGDRPVGLLWLSPDCKHFSKAKGGKPVSKKIRSLARVAFKWVREKAPDCIILENVEEFKTWGPLVRVAGKWRPCPIRKGRDFNRFVTGLRRRGYRVEWRELRACDYGAPTIRKRLFLIARRDGKPIVWPAATHGAPTSPDVDAGRLLPWRAAAECIDWSIPCPSIFDRKRPLADATCRRIARGIMRYVVQAAVPFLVRVNHGEVDRSGKRRGQGEHATNMPLPTVTASPEFAVAAPTLLVNNTGHAGGRCDEPLHTVTTGGHHALVAPVITECANGSSPRSMSAAEPLRTACAETKGGHFALAAATLVQTGYGERAGQAPRAMSIEKPLGTVVAGSVKAALVAAFIAKHYTGATGSPLAEPLATITTTDHNSLVAAHIQRDFGTSTGHRIDAPLGTITADAGGHAALVETFLVKYYGSGPAHQAIDLPAHTLTTKPRLGLVYAFNDRYVIVDIGFRMLRPRELYLCQGFPPSYIIDWGLDEHSQRVTFTIEAQVRMVGNSVSPYVAAAIVRANCAHLALAVPAEEVAV